MVLIKSVLSAVKWTILSNVFFHLLIGFDKGIVLETSIMPLGTVLIFLVIFLENVGLRY